MTLQPHPFYTQPWWRRARVPALLAALAFVVFTAFAGERVLRPTENNHFVYLADSYLHGTLAMRVAPPHGNDWASVTHLTLASGQTLDGLWWDRGAREFLDLEGYLYRIDAHDLRGAREDRTYYVSFPPMPAVMMLPGVAIWGMAFNDLLFVLLFAALNVGLVYVVLRRLILGGLLSISLQDALWWTAFFAFGSNYLWCAIQGDVWFAALTLGCTFTLGYMLASFDARHPLLAGALLAGAFATRTPLLFSVVFFAAFFLFPGGRVRQDFGRKFWRDGMLFASIPIVVGVTLMLANAHRFGSLTEFGHTYLAAGQIDRIKEYGLFNVHFLTRNLMAMFVLLPMFLPSSPWIQISRHGLALWFTSPALFGLLAPIPPASDAVRFWRRAAWATVAVIFIPHVFYQNTGWVQFGYRFSLDYLPYLTVLLALSRPRLHWGWKLAILAGIGVCALGAVSFGRMPELYGEWMLEP